MKLPCEVIRDLLPLYAENMVSAQSRALTEEHLNECAACRAELDAIRIKTPDMQFRLNSAQEFVKYEKKKKRRYGWKGAGLTALAILAVILIRLLMVSGMFSIFALNFALSKPSIDKNAENYSHYMGENADKYYRDKWNMDESIFPAEITPDMQVQDYLMAYYCIWDAQYLSYLTVTYTPEDYAAECKRLESCGITDYKGYYGVTGFADASDPIAMNADSYYGFIYAMHTPDQENTITYVEMIFCNYYYDLDYQQYIPEQYLPLGFDATMDNPYMRQKNIEDGIISPDN